MIESIARDAYRKGGDLDDFAHFRHEPYSPLTFSNICDHYIYRISAHKVTLIRSSQGCWNDRRGGIE